MRPSLSQSQTQALRVSYTNINAARWTASIDSYILGVTQTGDVDIRMHTASAVGAGALIVVKDQVASRARSKLSKVVSKMEWNGWYLNFNCIISQLTVLVYLCDSISARATLNFLMVSGSVPPT